MRVVVLVLCALFLHGSTCAYRPNRPTASAVEDLLAPGSYEATILVRHTPEDERVYPIERYGEETTLGFSLLVGIAGPSGASGPTSSAGEVVPALEGTGAQTVSTDAEMWLTMENATAIQGAESGALTCRIDAACEWNYTFRYTVPSNEEMASERVRTVLRGVTDLSHGGKIDPEALVIATFNGWKRVSP